MLIVIVDIVFISEIVLVFVFFAVIVNWIIFVIFGVSLIMIG